MSNMSPTEVIETMSEFTQQVKNILETLTKNKKELKELRDDAKKFVEALYNLSRRENMETFRKFARELERFNNNAELLAREMNDLKTVVNNLNEVANSMSDLMKAFKGD